MAVPVTGGDGTRYNMKTYLGESEHVQAAALVTISGGVTTPVSATQGLPAKLVSDDPAVVSLAVLDDWDESDRAKVNPIVGQAGIAGNAGAATANTVRVALASDVPMAAGENHIGNIGGHTVVKSVALTLSTTPAYTAGDLLADTQVLTGALRVTNGTGLLTDLMVIDQDDQKPSFDLYILGANVSMGTENSAPSITDVNALNIRARIPVFSADYADLGGCAVVNYAGLNRALRAATGTSDLYLAAVLTAGTPTHTATGITVSLGIIQD